MPKITYVEKKFQGNAQAVIATVNRIIEKYQADDMNMTVRQIYYQIVTTGDDNMEVLGFADVNGSRNNEKSYNRLVRICSDGRMAGLIDWDAIEDLSRNLKGNSHWRDPGQMMRAARYSFQLDRWEGQPYRPEVWIEKEALIGVISKTCVDLDVAYYACKGYVSLSEMWRASNRFEDFDQQGQQPIIIHLGDHDPSGIDMTRDIGTRQDTFLDDIGLQVERIALNMDQVQQYGPPPNPTKLKDSRAPEYIRKFGYDSWELDALNPTVLRSLIKETVLSYRDEEIYDETIEKENRYIEILRNVEENWERL